MFEMRIGRNEPCPCGSRYPDGRRKKYKHCCLGKQVSIPLEVVEHFSNLPKEPFEKGGFLTGRQFIGTVFKGSRMRAVGNTVYRRPIDETFHFFLLRTFWQLLGEEWFDAQSKKDIQHPIATWYLEADKVVNENSNQEKISDKISGAKLTGNTRSLLSLAYDFYSLKHCGATVLPKLLNRLKNENEFQGARYEIAVGGLVARAGFQIEWVNDTDKHCEFIGVHQIMGDKAAFEVKSHRREGVLGYGDGAFDPEKTRIKIFDHVREALGQRSREDVPLIVFDDLNLPLTLGMPNDEKKWFEESREQLEKYKFFDSDEYKRCSALFITNFSWHFHYDLPPEKNEFLIYFSLGGKYSLKAETIQYLKLASEQYGHVPAMLHELEEQE